MSSRGTSFKWPGSFAGVAASEELTYVAGECGISSLNHIGTEVAKYVDPDKYIAYPVLGPGGLLFCVLYKGANDQDQIAALDAQTLQPRQQFGLSLLNDAREMAVVGEELFVCDCGNDRLQVFTLADEHRRSMTGEWKRPAGLCFVNGRLYLVEESQELYEDEDESEPHDPLRGRRIFVLSSEGEKLVRVGVRVRASS